MNEPSSSTTSPPIPLYASFPRPPSPLAPPGALSITPQARLATPYTQPSHPQGGGGGGGGRDGEILSHYTQPSPSQLQPPARPPSPLLPPPLIISILSHPQ